MEPVTLTNPLESLITKFYLRLQGGKPQLTWQVSEPLGVFEILRQFPDQVWEKIATIQTDPNQTAYHFTDSHEDFHFETSEVVVCYRLQIYLPDGSATNNTEPIRFDVAWQRCYQAFKSRDDVLRATIVTQILEIAKSQVNRYPKLDRSYRDRNDMVQDISRKILEHLSQVWERGGPQHYENFAGYLHTIVRNEIMKELKVQTDPLVLPEAMENVTSEAPEKDAFEETTDTTQQLKQQTLDFFIAFYRHLLALWSHRPPEAFLVEAWLEIVIGKLPLSVKKRRALALDLLPDPQKVAFISECLVWDLMKELEQKAQDPDLYLISSWIERLYEILKKPDRNPSGNMWNQLIDRLHDHRPTDKYLQYRIQQQDEPFMDRFSKGNLKYLLYGDEKKNIKRGLATIREKMIKESGLGLNAELRYADLFNLNMWSTLTAWNETEDDDDE